MSNPLTLKVVRVVPAGSAGQLVQFALVGADADTLAIRVFKERGVASIEVTLPPTVKYLPGQEFTFDPTLIPADGNDAVVAPVTPPFQVGYAKPSVPEPVTPVDVPPTPAVKTPLELAEEQLAKDAAALTALQNEQA